MQVATPAPVLQILNSISKIEILWSHRCLQNIFLARIILNGLCCISANRKMNTVHDSSTTGHGLKSEVFSTLSHLLFFSHLFRANLAHTLIYITTLTLLSLLSRLLLKDLLKDQLALRNESAQCATIPGRIAQRISI